MVTYPIPDAAGDDVRLVVVPAGRKRHARLGETVQLQRAGKAAGKVVCAYRAELVLSSAGLHRALAPVFTDPGAGLARLCWAAEIGTPHDAEHQGKLALACGFADWAAFIADAGQGADADGRVRRQVIGWAEGA